MSQRVIVVSQDQQRIRLDRFLVCQGIASSRSRLQRLIAEGAVLVDGMRRPPGYLVKPGDHIEILELPSTERPTAAAEDIPLQVVYEDEYLMVIDKPAGMVVHPAPGNYRGTLVNALLGRRQKLSGLAGPERPGILHRLDKDTSGLLLVAKQDEAHRLLAAQLMSRRMTRTYQAVVWGRLEGQGSISAPLGRSPFDRQRMGVSPLRGRPAVSHYRVLENFGRVATLVEVNLETGRTHQIRVHFEHLGHPVAGDPTYNRGLREIQRKLGPRAKQLMEDIAQGLKRQALHAWRLMFIHPATKEKVEFRSALPADIETILERLRGISIDK